MLYKYNQIIEREVGFEPTFSAPITDRRLEVTLGYSRIFYFKYTQKDSNLHVSEFVAQCFIQLNYGCILKGWWGSNPHLQLPYD